MEGSDPINFFREIYSDNPYRVEGKRSIGKDLIKFYKNRFLRSFWEKKLIERYYQQRYPILFIVGSPRSGTTFFSQFLIHVLGPAYISNYMAARWMAPLYAKVQRDRYRKAEEEVIDFRSKLGNTKGLDAPHEFGYFWQYWMKHRGYDELTEDELEAVPWERIREELYGISNYVGSPLLIKSVDHTDFIIPRIRREFPLSSFLFIDREPGPTVRSILSAREKRYGDQRIWWSVRPRGYEALKALSPEEQVAFQYFYIKRSIEVGVASIPSDMVSKVNYEDLVEDPKGVLEDLIQMPALKGSPVRPFERDDIVKGQNEEREELSPSIQEAIERFRPMSLEGLRKFKEELKP